MQEIQNKVEEAITGSAVNFKSLAEDWAVHSLRTYQDELLDKALDLAKALVNFHAELYQGNDPFKP